MQYSRLLLHLASPHPPLIGLILFDELSKYYHHWELDTHPKACHANYALRPHQCYVICQFDMPNLSFYYNITSFHYWIE